MWSCSNYQSQTFYVLKRGRQRNHCPNACKIKIGNDRKKKNIGKNTSQFKRRSITFASVECGSMLRWVLLAPQVIPSVSKKWHGGPDQEQDQVSMGHQECLDRSLSEVSSCIFCYPTVGLTSTTFDHNKQNLLSFWCSSLAPVTSKTSKFWGLPSPWNHAKMESMAPKKKIDF